MGQRRLLRSAKEPVSVLPLHIRARKPQNYHSLIHPTHHSIPPAPSHRPHQRWLWIQLTGFYPLQPPPTNICISRYIYRYRFTYASTYIYIHIFILYVYIFIYAFNEVLCFQLLPSSAGICSRACCSVRGKSAGRSALQAARGESPRAHACPRLPARRRLSGAAHPSLRSRCRAALLRVLQDAPVSEVVDVTTEENQLGVSVLGHLAVQRRGVLFRGRNHNGFPARDPFDSTLCQGTKSAMQRHWKS